MNFMDTFAKDLHARQLEVTAQLSALETSASAWTLTSQPKPRHISHVTHTVGGLIEKGGFAFSHLSGDQLPQAATARNPQYQNHAFAVCGLSSVLHPHNPHIPTIHMNVRYFELLDTHGQVKKWWLGGGLDMTPYLVHPEDYTAWHQACQSLCQDSPDLAYAPAKQRCDDYFYLPHRQEWRGIGGLFFDDWQPPSREAGLAWLLKLTQTYTNAMLVLLEKRHAQPFSPLEKDFQTWRRSRYVEFNLLHDRGTKFGIEYGGNVDAILMSMPPQAHWTFCDDSNPDWQALWQALQAINQPRDWAS